MAMAGKTVVAILVLCGLVTAVQAAAISREEQQKIEALITHIEGMTDARFIRNGKSYEPKIAACPPEEMGGEPGEGADVKGICGRGGDQVLHDGRALHDKVEGWYGDCLRRLSHEARRRG
jgi:hypothetical protein